MHRSCRFNPWVRKIHWKRKWQHTLVFLPGKPHGQMSLACYIVHRIVKSWAWISTCTNTHTGVRSGVESANAGDIGGIIPVLGRSPGERNGNPLQYFCLGNPINRGAWWATVHGVTKESDMTEHTHAHTHVHTHTHTHTHEDT